jgi:hypothetical protein
MKAAYILFALASTQAFAAASPAELGFVTQYFAGRFSAVKSADSRAPMYIDLSPLVAKMRAAGFRTPNAPSTLDYFLNKLDCAEITDRNHRARNFTPRCVANAISAAQQNDKSWN